MGCHGSKVDDDRAEKEVADTLNSAKRSDDLVIKLLLIGPGGSGKTTFRKQLQVLYGKQYDLEERKQYIPAIYKNILFSMKLLLQATADMESCHLSDSSLEKPRADFLDRMAMSTELAMLSAEDAENVLRFWADSGVKAAYEERSKIPQLQDSCPHFLEKAREIAQSDYVPNMEDILLCRVQTTGITEVDFTIQKKVFKLVDVGGQRSERKKWLHCFEGVTSMLYVAAISEYDQVIYEDSKANSLQEAYSLFQDLANRDDLTRCGIILFLNKVDLLEKKLGRSSFRDSEADFVGDEKDLEQVKNHIQNKFRALAPNRKNIYMHFTCAIDDKNVYATFEDCRNLIIRNGLNEFGVVLQN